MSERALVIGPGYVGKPLASALVAAHVEVFVLSRTAASIAGVQHITGDVRYAAALPELPSVDYVVFMAAADRFDEEEYHATYVRGITNVTAKIDRERLQRFLFASSTGVYGDESGRWVDEGTTPTANAFSGTTLREAEGELLRLLQDSVCARFGGIYGPGRTAFIDRVKAGAESLDQGEPRYMNRIHRDDCVGILMHLMRTPNPAPVYLCVDDDPAPRNETITWIMDQLGLPLPRGLGGPAFASLRGNKRCSNRRLKESGYRFLYPTYREGYLPLLR